MIRLLIQLCIFMSAAALAPAGMAAQLRDFSWQTGASGLTFRIELDTPAAPHYTNEILDHNYFYLDYWDMAGPTEPAEWSVPGPGVHFVRRVYYPDQRVLRLVFYSRDELRVAIGGDGRIQQVRVAPIQYRKLGEAVGGPRKRVVIDAGHGGKPGDAQYHIGAASSRKVGGRTLLEKEITLQIAQRLQRMIDMAPNIEAVMTRSEDVYVSLPERVEMGERARGDLFLSIHLNATDSRKKTARGFEVYYLSDGSRVVNNHLLALENEWPASERNLSSSREDVAAILRSLAGDKIAERQAESRQLAGLVGDEFRRWGYSREFYRGVKSMPFRVLVQYAMPAVLVECYFLDNPTEAELVVRAEVQERIAALLFNGINRYFAMTDPAFEPSLASRGEGN